MPGFLNDGFLGGKGKGGGTRGEPGKAGATPEIGPNGNWYINGKDTGKPAGGIDLSKFKENEVVTVDAKTGQLKPSGVFAQDGDIEAEPDSITIGSHEISSSAENVLVKNLATNKLYAPLWQEVAENARTAFIRGHSALERVDRYTGTTRKYTNPVFDIVMDQDQTTFVLYINLVNALADMTMEVYLGTEKLYRAQWENVPASVGSDVIKLDLPTPADFKQGVTYTVKLFSKSGDVILRGGARGPRWSVDRVRWVDIPIATQPWVLNQPSSNPVTHIALVGTNRLQITQADGSINVINLPAATSTSPNLKPLQDSIAVLEQNLTQQGNDIFAMKAKLGVIEHNINDLHSSYVYNGDMLPAYPDDAQGMYFITLKGQAARQIDLDLPNPTSGTIENGAIFYLENDNAQASVTLAGAGVTIGGKPNLIIPPKHHVLLTKSGSDWLIAMSKSNAATALEVSSADVSKAVDHGVFTGSGSLQNLDDGWSQIKVGNTGVTDRPGDSQGDLIVFKQEVSGTAPSTGHGVMMAFGKDTGNKDSVWSKYRVGDQWSPWFKASGTPADLTKINNDIADISKRQASITGDISALKTSVGAIYAPSKSVFDSAVNALIDAKLQNFKPGGGRGGGGGDRPETQLPRIYVMFSNDVPTAIDQNEAVTSTTGEATIHRIPTTKSRVFVLVENDNDEASKVKGVSVDGGLSAVWQPRDLVIDGKKYRAFYSAGAYSEKELTIKVDFGQ